MTAAPDPTRKNAFSGLFIRAGLALLAAGILLPQTAHAHPPGGMVLAMVLIPILGAVLLAALIKWIIGRYTTAFQSKISGKAVLAVALGETILLFATLALSILIVKKYLPLAVLGFFSVEAAEWYLGLSQPGFAGSGSFLEGLLFWALFQIPLAVLPNLALLRSRDRRYLDALKKPKAVLAAGLLGAISMGLLFAPASILYSGGPPSQEAGATRDLASELLHLASARGFVTLTASLIERGVDVNGFDRGGLTPLMQAAFNGRLETARLLLEHGAEVNVRDHLSGRTALIMAVSSGNPELVELLLAQGADVNAREQGGWTARQYAEKTGRDEIRDILVKHGAEK